MTESIISKIESGKLVFNEKKHPDPKVSVYVAAMPEDSPFKALKLTSVLGQQVMLGGVNKPECTLEAVLREEGEANVTVHCNALDVYLAISKQLNERWEREQLKQIEREQIVNESLKTFIKNL